jgi:hypothetical protein
VLDKAEAPICFYRSDVPRLTVSCSSALNDGSQLSVPAKSAFLGIGYPTILNGSKRHWAAREMILAGEDEIAGTLGWRFCAGDARTSSVRAVRSFVVSPIYELFRDSAAPTVVVADFRTSTAEHSIFRVCQRRAWQINARSFRARLVPAKVAIGL